MDADHASGWRDVCAGQPGVSCLRTVGGPYCSQFGPDPAPLPVRQDERTQQLGAEEVVELLRHPKPQELEDSSGEMPALPLHANPLPDVYPEEHGPAKA